MDQVIGGGWRLTAMTALWLVQSPATSERVADFSVGIPPGWQRHAFASDTHYERVEVENGRWVLKAEALNAASALGTRLKLRARDRPIIRWRWKAERLPRGGNEATKRGDDAAARVLLVFHESVLPWRVKTICYLWANTLRKGEVANSVFSSNIKLVAVESGHDEIGSWKTEERDYAADYERLFREPADFLLGISIMTDSDNTHSVAIAYYDFIEIGSRETR